MTIFRDGVGAGAAAESRDELVRFFDEQAARLHRELTAADPAEEVYMWASEKNVGYIRRRQAHEALIHRLDAEQRLKQLQSAGLGGRAALMLDQYEAFLHYVHGRHQLARQTLDRAEQRVANDDRSATKSEPIAQMACSRAEFLLSLGVLEAPGFQEQFGEVRAVLPGNSSDECAVGHGH